MKRQKIPIFLLFILISNPGWGSEKAGVYCGIITKITGEVKIDKTGDGIFSRANINDYIYYTSVIITGANGFLSISHGSKTINVGPGLIKTGKDIYYEHRLPWLDEMSTEMGKTFKEVFYIIFPEETIVPSGTRDFNADPNPYDDIEWVLDEYEEDELDQVEIDNDKIKKGIDEQEKEKTKKSSEELFDDMITAVADSSWYKNLVYRKYNEALKEMNELTEFPIPWYDFMILKGFCHFQMKRYIDAVSYYSYVMESIDVDEIDWDKKGEFYMQILCQKSVSNFITGEVTQSIKTMQIVLENAGDSSLSHYAREFMRMMYTREGI